jgi:hypothetical protein
MGDPLKHSESSARLFGGVPKDYLHIHTVMDSSKLFLADWRHRALLHNTFGIHVFEQLIGASFTRQSDGKGVCTRTVITQHIMEDLGAVPTAGEFLREMPLKPWMTGISAKQKLRMQSLTIEGDGANEAYIKSEVKWQHYNTAPPISGDYLVCHENGQCLFSTYSKELNNWSNISLSELAYWAEMPMTPVCND